MATAHSNARAHRPMRDWAEKYQTYRDADQSAKVLTERTGVAHKAYMLPDGTITVLRAQ